DVGATTRETRSAGERVRREIEGAWEQCATCHSEGRISKECSRLANETHDMAAQRMAADIANGLDTLCLWARCHTRRRSRSECAICQDRAPCRRRSKSRHRPDVAA